MILCNVRQTAQPQHESPLQAQFPSHDDAFPDLFTLSPPEPLVGASAGAAVEPGYVVERTKYSIRVP
jgi:hypothetical protein